MIEIIEKMFEKEDRLVKKLEEEIGQYPKGSLEFQETKKEGRAYWKCSEEEEHRKYGKVKRKKRGGKRDNRVRLYPADVKIVQGIRRRKICELQLKAAKQNWKWLKNLLDHYQNSSESEAVKQLKEPYKSLQGFEQYAETGRQVGQSENPYYQEQLIHKNSVGELFRSKAEMHISELLLTQGIPYRYEKKLVATDGEIKYPDFTLKRPETGEEKYIEYFGMVDNETYTESMVRKIKWYLDHGFVPGKDVLFLFETSTSGMDLTAITKQILYFLEM